MSSILRASFVSLIVLASACATDPSADLDLDGVADAEDNCPETMNGEQFDADADGAGDACDLTVRMNDQAFGEVDADELNLSAIAVADIANFTDAPQPFAVWTDSDELVPELVEGIVEPGQIRTIYVNADARGLEPGAWLAGNVTVETDEGETHVEAGAETLPPPPPTTCTFSLKRDFVTVTDGEGGADPDLELVVDFTFYNSGTEIGDSTYSGTLKKGATAGTDVTAVSVGVNSGTWISRTWEAYATEEDTWDGDDHGTGSGTLTFTCSGSGSVSSSDSITLGNASISVGVKATW